MSQDVRTSGKSMEETVPKYWGLQTLRSLAYGQALNRMEVGQGGVKSALDENFIEKYGF